jgi:hypothetical protein
MCSDIRRWNMSNEIARRVKRAARDPRIIGGGSMWERTAAQGFDPHFHNLLVGDRPGSLGALLQEDAYKDGFNGLGSGFRGHRDDFWRPNRILSYEYIEEDDMFEDKDRKMLREIHTGLEKFREGTLNRDRTIKAKLSAAIAAQGRAADALTLAINRVDDEGIKRQLKTQQTQILDTLKELEFVDGPDNPSDDAMNEIHTQ